MISDLGCMGKLDLRDDAQPIRRLRGPHAEGDEQRAGRGSQPD
jgi:hypothetical protein